MNKNHLYWVVPLMLVIGFMLGLYLGIPNHITIDTGDNLKEMMTDMENISMNFNDACHNLTFECNCDTYDMTELNKRWNMLLYWQMESHKDNCDKEHAVSYMCMHRDYCKWITDDYCNTTYEYWGNRLT